MAEAIVRLYALAGRPFGSSSRFLLNNLLDCFCKATVISVLVVERSFPENDAHEFL
jgi:hypothetical protein